MEETVEKLRALNLSAMIEGWKRQQGDPTLSGATFEERFGLLVDAEWLHRENRRVSRNLREAKLRFPQACLEGIEYAPERMLDRGLLRQLSSGQWIRQHQDVVITGATGTGKSYLACALGQLACRRGHRVLYRRASRLYQELHLARADGSFARLLSRLAKVEVLVLEDWGLTPLKSQERVDLLEVLEDRHGSRSTVVTSQYAPENWHEQVGDPTLADAICDRLLHHAHRLALKGPSRRKGPSPASEKEE